MDRQRYIRLVAECREMLRQQVALDDAIGQVNPEHYRQHRAQLDALTGELYELTHQTRVIVWPTMDLGSENPYGIACVLAQCCRGATVGTAQGRTDRLWQVHLCAPLCAELDAREVVAEAVRRGIAVTAYRGLVEAVA